MITSKTGAPLTGAEREAAEAIQQRVAELGDQQNERLVQEDKISNAAVKIQVWIKSDRSIHKPLAFTLSFWESGKRLHGGGDESMWVCRRRPSAPKPKRPRGVAHRVRKTVATPDGCGKLIPGDHAVRGFVVCPHCEVRWDTEYIADSLFYRMPVAQAAVKLTEWYRVLGSNCDIYVKFRAEDVRVKMMAQRYGLRHAQKHKGLVIYPNAHIIRDTLGGATVESRFKALLLA